MRVSTLIFSLNYVFYPFYIQKINIGHRKQEITREADGGKEKLENGKRRMRERYFGTCTSKQRPFPTIIFKVTFLFFADGEVAA